MSEKIKEIAVVGGGPAGLTAAIFASLKGASVTVFEKNKIVAKKLRITGKGRCNVCNDCTPREVMEQVTRNAKFLYSSLFTFPPADVKDFFENLGVPLKTERGRRVFPVSDKAADVAEALIKKAKSSGVKIVHTKIEGVRTDGDKVVGVKTENGFLPFDAVILATGGVSYPATGSTGDGFKMAKELGISVTPLCPSLVPIICRENTAEMMGLSLKNVTLSVTKDGKTVFSEMGEMLFTHFGISGPLALSASAHIQNAPVKSYSMEIDLKPALDEAVLDKRLQSDFLKFSVKDFSNSLGNLLPKSMIPSVISRSNIPPHIKCCEITKEMRKNLLETLKHYKLTPVAFRPFDEAIITKGGVDVGEISPKSMMSKKYCGLFFAGEIIDVDAYTGGYNLQIAWSTGKKAGESAADYLYS